MNAGENTEERIRKKRIRQSVYKGLAGVLLAAGGAYAAGVSFPNINVNSPQTTNTITQGENSITMIESKNDEDDIESRLIISSAQPFELVSKEILESKLRIEAAKSQIEKEIESIPMYLRCFELKIEAEGIKAIWDYIPCGNDDFLWYECIMRAKDGTKLRFECQKAPRELDRKTKYEKYGKKLEAAEITLPSGNTYVFGKDFESEIMKEIVKSMAETRHNYYLNAFKTMGFRQE